MKVGELKISKSQIIIVLLLLIGLAAGIYLVTTTRIFKSRANINDAVSISTSDAGKTVSCSGNACTTDTLNVTISFPDLDALTR